MKRGKGLEFFMSDSNTKCSRVHEIIKLECNEMKNITTYKESTQITNSLSPSLAITNLGKKAEVYVVVASM